jgi:hypothetical protein
VAYENGRVFDFDERTGALGEERPSGVSTLRLVSEKLVGNRFLVSRGDDFASLRTLAVSPGTGRLTIASEVRLPSGRQFGYPPALADRTIFAHSGSSGGSGVTGLGTYVVNETTGEITPGVMETTASLLPLTLLPRPNGPWMFAQLRGNSANPRQLGVAAVLSGGSWVLRDTLSHSVTGTSQLVADPDGRYLYFIGEGSIESQGNVSVFSFEEATAKLSLVDRHTPVDLRRFQLDVAAVDPTGRFLAVATRRFLDDPRAPLASELHFLRIGKGTQVSFQHVDGFVQARWDGDIGLSWSPEGRFLFCRDGVFELGADGRFAARGTETRRLRFVRIPGAS